MIAPPSIWRERWKTWLPMAVACAAAFAFLVLYVVAYAERVPLLNDRLTAERQRLESLEGDRASLDQARQRLNVNQSRIQEFYDERLSTERRRFTATVAEVRDLARRAGLDPQLISYPKTEILDQGLVKKGIVFGVNGSYEDLRRFLNLVELSDRFVAVEEIGLGAREQSGGALEISLSLSAWFASETVPEAVSRSATAAGTGVARRSGS
jgi:Tfp pilus assembly protein PilO